ncbi:FAD binding domain-domain-containing protein [Coniella lustricola]|uniref:FAD binding domain-domain-containing protein n=1 Tax=Coniella lustricola TaxID=2025994 RepID=A0A2T2ZV73_9PEZI|nr:FAD binding domain-domain-containing protein [Coniella lustricola]
MGDSATHSVVHDGGSSPAGSAAHPIIDTPYLIVGAGPAGASLACFLAAYNLTGLIIAASPGTAHTPRAHITNMAAIECLRDIDLETACRAAATAGDSMQHTRWCASMAGAEYARIYSWGNDPARKGDYDAASPCAHVDLPQTLLEPVLTTRAVHGGWQLRFDTRLVGFTRRKAGARDGDRDGDGAGEVILSEVEDMVTGLRYTVRSKYLFGCDGARSQVVRALDIPLDKKPGQGFALNVLVKADLARLMEHRTGNLHWVFTPDKDYPPWGWAGIVRMVKPWTEWMFIMFPLPGADLSADLFSPTADECMPRIKELIGDDSIHVEILDVSKWWVNEIVAEYYSDGNVHCFGDATHRHPPFNGLGSNTCIQDAYNLAWKLAYVEAGKAAPKILQTFSAERQPVGRDVITRANQGLRDHMGWIRAMGMMEPDKQVRTTILAEFDNPGPVGRKRRQDFQRGIEQTSTEFHGLGIEMNQLYVSDAVYLDDETLPPPLPQDPVRELVISTYPGKRLPHAWLNTRTPGNKFSTIDLAGHRQFCLLTGPGGDQWKTAAAQVGKALGVQINAYSIGWKQDYEDVYFDWARRCEIEEDGCVLARPDRVVAWRCKEMIPGVEAKLDQVMRKVLSLH